MAVKVDLALALLIRLSRLGRLSRKPAKCFVTENRSLHKYSRDGNDSSYIRRLIRQSKNRKFLPCGNQESLLQRSSQLLRLLLPGRHSSTRRKNPTRAPRSGLAVNRVSGPTFQRK